MLCCSVCNDLFHGITFKLNIIESCVMPSLRTGSASIRNSIGQSKTNKFVCMKCSRTRRPRIKNVINLLVGLQRSTVRVPEGELLQCVAEIMINWQIRVKRLLCKEQVADLLRSHGSETSSSPINYKQLSMFNTDNENQMSAFLNEPNISHVEEQKSDLKQSGRRTRKAQLVPRNFECPPMELTEYDFSCIEELMVEGDLYQISSHEADKLWELLQVSRGSSNPLFPDIVNSTTSRKEGVGKGRPRGKKRLQSKDEVKMKKPRKVKNTSNLILIMIR
ncbi:lysine-specific demethylase 5A-like [Octopus sinensis]|uniref:Lysine-specific demethylase 5A-like n=1 Tax=Octopus sinensis TaxID=2607531 RepID=A0A7E6EIP4_9MOLL|nr:lysine-specific demethylase 5A-like [Octopus sinensis]